MTTALKVPDLPLAKLNADKPGEEDPQLKKKVFLLVSKYQLWGVGQSLLGPPSISGKR